MVAIFHLNYLGHRIKYGNLEVENTTQQLLSTTRLCCSIEFIESLLFWVILVTYNMGIYIFMYIYKDSYIHSFFVIFNCNVFSALHAKHFEIWKNILWNWWVDCFIARSIKWCDIFGCSWWIHFHFYEVFFLEKNVCALVTFSLAFCWVNQLLVNLLWGFCLKLLLPLEWYCQSHLMNLIQLIVCRRADNEFSWNNFSFIVVKEFWCGKKY